MRRDDVLIGVAELQRRLAEVTVLDVRWRLGDAPGAGRERYAAGHLPGARFLDLETVLTRHTANPQDGRHPLPDAVALAEGLGAVGVDPAREVVVYDEPGSCAAARAWWVLRWAGLTVRVLDGGIDAWAAAAAALPRGAVDAEPTRLSLATGQRPTVTADGAQHAGRVGVLVDVRAPQRFRGELEPIDPVAGHIPGAVNVPVEGLFDTSGRLPDEATLRRRFGDALDGRPVTAYCGSGVTASQAVLALATLGVEAALYPGSWSAWCNDPSRPVQTGPGRV
ncbi:MAG: sulfurtransferase [Dermatophilaceae bacterium]